MTDTIGVMFIINFNRKRILKALGIFFYKYLLRI